MWDTYFLKLKQLLERQKPVGTSDVLVGTIFKSLYEGEAWIDKQEGKATEITVRQQNEKRILKSEATLKDLWYNIRQNSIHIIEVPEGEERSGQKNYLKNNLMFYFFQEYSTFSCKHIHMCLFFDIYMCIYIYVYIYVHIHMFYSRYFSVLSPYWVKYSFLTWG